MAIGDVFGIKLHMNFAGQECRPGFYLVEGSGGGGVNPVRSAALAVVNALGPDALDGFSAETTLSAIDVTDIQPATALSVSFPVSPIIVGTVADDNAVPPQDSMLIRWLTALKSGKGKYARRGRTFVPGIYSTGQVSGFLTTDLQDALSAFASKLFDPFVNDGTAYQMHCVSFVPNTNPREIREINPVNDFTVDNVVDIQRRRRPGRGI